MFRSIHGCSVVVAVVLWLSSVAQATQRQFQITWDMPAAYSSEVWFFACTVYQGTNSWTLPEVRAQLSDAGVVTFYFDDYDLTGFDFLDTCYGVITSPGGVHDKAADPDDWRVWPETTFGLRLFYWETSDTMEVDVIEEEE